MIGSAHLPDVCIEGPWDEVMKVIGMAHTMLHEKGVMRIQTDIRVGSRYVYIMCIYM